MLMIACHLIRLTLRRETYAYVCLGGRTLGTPRFMRDDTWIQCGLLEEEDVLAREHTRDFCGLWFHARCIGILRVPKDSKERTACLTCLQVGYIIMWLHI